MRLSFILLFVITMAALPMESTCRAQDPESSNGSHWRLELAAGGGFSGVRVIEVIEHPYFDCQGQNCTPVDSLKVISKNGRYVWQPTVSVGLVMRYLLKKTPKSQDSFGVGLGVHIAAVPTSDLGSTRAAPAVTLHLGTKQAQVFYGLCFIAQDNAAIPGGGSHATVPVDFPSADLIERGTGTSPPTMYFGIIFGGDLLRLP